MMSDSVERWLQTFLCSQYARIFEAYGYKTLHSVCLLQLPNLLAMGVPRNHCEKILENVNNLRQTMFGRNLKPADSNLHYFNKYNHSLNPAVWALKTVAMNANYRGMNPYPDEYGSYGQSGNNMQSMGYHQGGYENSNMAIMNPMGGAGGGGYALPGYDASQSHMMMATQGQMSAHSAMYQQQAQQAYMAQQQQQQYYSGGNGTGGGGGGNGSNTGGQYAGQTYPMQGGTGNIQAMGSNNQFYGTGNSGQSHGSSAAAASNKMVPPPHHHLRNTSGQQNPQQVADSILQMASAFPTHHTVQVPLKNRHAPYQIPRSPQNFYPEKGQQVMGNQGQQQQQQQAVSNPPGNMVGGQQQQQQQQQQTMGSGGPSMQAKTSQSQVGQMGQVPAGIQAAAMMYATSSPHNQMPPRSSPMSPLMMASPAAAGGGHQGQAQCMASPSTMHSPNSATAVCCSPVPSSPGLANMRSPCSVPMRSPAHLSSGYPISSPPQRPYAMSDSSAAAQRCSPSSMHSPASHCSSPYVSHHVSSPPQSHIYSAHSPYKMDMLMDSGQGPGGQGVQAPLPQRNPGSDPLQSLQKLVMLPETQVVDPKSVVSDGCLQNCDESSKNFEGPAEQSREAVDCSAGFPVSSSPPIPQAPSAHDAVADNKLVKSDPPNVPDNELWSKLVEQPSTFDDGVLVSKSVKCEQSSTLESKLSDSSSHDCEAASQSYSSAASAGVNEIEKLSSRDKKFTGASDENAGLHDNEQKVQSTVFDTGDQISLSSSKAVSCITDIRTTYSDICKPDIQHASPTKLCSIDSSPTAETKASPKTETNQKTEISPKTETSPKTDTVAPKISAAGSSEVENIDTKYTTTSDMSSHAHCNGLVKSPSAKSESTDVVLGLQDTETNSLSDHLNVVSDNMSTATAIRTEDVKHSSTCSSKSETDTTKTAAKPSPPKKRHSERLLKASCTKSIKSANEMVAVDVTSKSDCGTNTNTIAASELSLDTAGTTKLANGYSEKHINGSNEHSADEASTKNNFRKKHHEHTKSTVRQETIACIDHVGSMTETKLMKKHKSKELVPSRSACIMTVVNGSVDMLTSCTGDLDSDNETEEQGETSVADTTSVVKEVGPAGNAVTTSLHPDSDNDGDSFSNGLDFGYDSPPLCETLADDGWKPDLENRLSSNGVDEADGNGGDAKNGTGKEMNLQSKGVDDSGTAKTTPPKPTRVVTRSVTGRAPKRKIDEAYMVDVKRTRRSPGATNTTNKQTDIMSLSMECDEINTKDSFSDVEVISSSDESTSFKDKKVDSKSSNSKNLNPSEKNCAASPVVVLTKPADKNAKLLSGTNVQVSCKTQTHRLRVNNRPASSHFHAIRGEKGRFISKMQVKSDPTPVPIKVDSDSEDEPLILVRRRSSKEEGSSGTVNNSETEEGTVKSNIEKCMVKTESSMRETNYRFQEGTKLFCSPTSSFQTSSIPSHPKPGPSRTSSPARSDSSSVPKKGKSQKIEPGLVSHKKSKNSSKSKSIKNKTPFVQVDTANDSFKDMKFSQTLNHLNKKKKGDSSHFSPFVRVQGKRDIPSKVIVFNHPLSDFKDPKSVNSKKNASAAAAPTTMIQITNFSSDKTVMVPSNKTTDSAWVCALCGKRSSFRYLGDLFGPYFLESHLSALTKNNEGGKRDLKQEPSSSGEAPMAHNTRRKSLGYRRTSSVDESVPVPQEVWVHEDCAMWSSGVYLVGSRIYGLEEALKAATSTVCACCKDKGAMLGCLHKGCNQNFHYMCAVDKQCFLDVENLSMLCLKHKDKRLKSAEASKSKP